MVPLNDVRGAVSGAAIAVPSRARPMVPTTPFTVGASRPTVVNGRVVLVTSARPNSSPWPGSCGQRLLLLLGAERLGVRLEAAQVRDQVGAGDAVHRGVVHLLEDRDQVATVVAVVALDHPHLPQRAGAVERETGEVAGQLGELGVPARRRQCQPVHVPLDVELGVPHPDRVVEPQRHPAQLAREVRDVADPGLDARRAWRRTSTAPASSTGRARSARTRASAAPASRGRGSSRRAPTTGPFTAFRRHLPGSLNEREARAVTRRPSHGNPAGSPGVGMTCC